MTLRESLGGPWATHGAVWVALLVPTTLLVLLRESATGFSDWWWPFVSAALQHAAVGIIVVGGGQFARRRYPVLPLALVASLWGMAGVARGLIAGTLAASVAGVDPEYMARSLVWLLGTLVWVPLIVYTAAELDRRRMLLGALDTATERIERQRLQADESSDEVRRSLETAVRQSLQPALSDLVSSVESSRDRLSVAALSELSMRVSQLHDRTADLAEPHGHSVERRNSARSTFRRAFDLPPRLPWLIAGLTVLSTTAALVPDVWRVFGDLAALELAVAIAAAGFVIGVLLTILTRLVPDSAIASDQRATAVACMGGILLGVYIMVNSGIDPITQNGLAVVPLLAIALTIACTVHVGAIVLADANLEAATQLERQMRVSELEQMAHDRLVDRERRRLAELMHGPVQGRLAACVMALNFAATSAPESGLPPKPADDGLIDSVLDHLRAVSRDLTVIAAAENPEGP